MSIYLRDRKTFITITKDLFFKNHTLKLTFMILFSVELSPDVSVIISCTLRKGIPSRTQNGIHSLPSFDAIFFRSFSQINPKFKLQFLKSYLIAYITDRFNQITSV